MHWIALFHPNLHSVLAVGITDDVDEAELLAIASQVNYIYEVADFSDLTSILAGIVDASCAPAGGKWGNLIFLFGICFQWFQMT